MTPDDVDARRLHQVRENLVGRDDTDDDTVLALCDALEAAWAERDEITRLSLQIIQDRNRELADCECRPMNFEDEAGNPVCVCPAGDGCKVTQDRERQARAIESNRLAEIESLRERAERAEASLEATRNWLTLEQAAVEERDAALARVRALCDQAATHGGTVATYAIRAAIEGDNQ